MKKNNGCLTDAQLQSELARCEFCEEKPCQAACPANCSPADFIMAARVGEKPDWRRAGALIAAANPLGWVCGTVCPDYFCMKACSRRTFDHPINIPAVQAAVMKKAYEVGLPLFKELPDSGKRVAVIGSGPAGLGAAAVLAQLGHRVTVFEKEKQLAGMANLIPSERLDQRILRRDLGFVKRLGRLEFRLGCAIANPKELLRQGRWPTTAKDIDSLRTGFDAVIVSAGLGQPVSLDIPGGEHVLGWQEYLADQNQIDVAKKKIAVLGGGAVAVDCATTAKRHGAAWVELVYRRKQQHMPLTSYERGLILEHGVEVTSCSKLIKIVKKGKRVAGMWIARTSLPRGKEPLPQNFVVNEKESPIFREFDVIVSAIGNRPLIPVHPAKGMFFAGDLILGASTVVEAVASGKNAALQADAWLRGEKLSRISNRAKSRVLLAGLNLRPVSLETEFFGRKIISPFLLSAAPHTDGYAQMQKAYEHGWAGGVMKTAFDDVPIHIPADYMTVIGASTYGNCDNVSSHPLDRVCPEIERLVKEFPDRLTLASTGGPVSGRDEADKAVWQANTRKLESAGAMGVEYSLSCPQGGDGTHGDLVSQNAELTARIIDWVMDASADDNPKLFKLTAAVTAIQPIVKRVLAVFAKYPGKLAGITLANSFPALTFKSSATRRRWEEGVVIGMSGEGVLPISNLTLAKVSGMGVVVSANGGAMNYRAAANFLALGAQTVQFCTIVMKHGLGIVDELHSGLSFLMQERQFRSVKELIGSALPDPIVDFNALSTTKRLPEVMADRCEHCGNCTRCPYQAISLDRRGIPTFDPARCVGCSLCAQKCFAGAISMRPRSPRELAALEET